MGARKNRIVFLLLLVIGIGYISYESVYLKPQTSIELYDEIAFADNFEQAKKVMIDDDKIQFREEDFKVLNEIDASPNKIRSVCDREVATGNSGILFTIVTMKYGL